MTIEEALAQIDVKSDEVQVTNSVFDPEVFEVIKTYPLQLETIANDRKIEINFKTSDIFDYIAEHIKFTKNCEITITNLTKKEIVDILAKKSYNLKLLFKETDIEKYIPEKFTPGLLRSYHGLFSSPEVEAILNYNALEGIKTLSKKIFSIKNINFMSLFIEEGAKLRKYYETIGEKNKFYTFFITDNKFYRDAEFKPFTVEDLRKFHEETGIKDLKDVMQQVSELKNLLDLGSTAEHAATIRKDLYDRLKLYNPILIYE